VVQTTPRIGTRAPKNSQVTLLLSTGPQLLSVPVLVGQPEKAAIQKITDARFAYDSKNSTRQFDAKVAKDTVIAAFGTNALDLATVTTYGENQPISLVVSVGAIPNVAGLSVADATRKLKSVDITATPGRDTYSDTIAAGNVVGIELADGQVVRPGNSVSLTVSKGKEQIAVPDIKGTPWTSAKKALTDLGFVIAFKNDSSRAIVATGLGDFATVSSVSPSGSTQVDKGSTVTVGLSIG
jgi:beta-lactam-binding protein with PASTA domain